MQTNCSDPVVLNLWHPIAAVAETPNYRVSKTVLLTQSIDYSLDENGQPTVSLSGSGGGATLPSRLDYGYIWTSLGEPPEALFEIPEYAEEDRRKLNAGSVGVNVSAPRAVENFLDMGHFPYVHTNILGAEPHTEVKEYDVAQGSEEILATECRFFQPMAAASAEGGMEVHYTYRIPHPYCVMLYKSSPLDPSRRDVIALFNQPVDEDRIRAHMLLCILDEDNSDTGLRNFQLTIFGQDKPILENQFPKKLPLDPRAETPIRADKSAIVYRRWLRDLGLTYGVIPHAA